MIRSLGFALALLLGVTQAQAQSNFTMPPPAGVVLNGAQVVASCGAGTLITTNPGYMSVDQTGKLCINATITTSSSSTVSGTISTSPVVITPISAGTLTVSCNAGCAGSGGTQSTSPTTVTPVTQVTSPWIIGGNATVNGTVSTSPIGGPAPVSVIGTVTTSIPGVQQTQVNNTVTISCNAGCTGAGGTQSTSAVTITPVFITNPTSVGQAVSDPCTYAAKTTSSFGPSAATSSILVTGVSAKLIYVCSLAIIDAAGEAVSIVEGTSAFGSLLPVMGSVQAPNGLNLAANGGLTLGGGLGTVAKTTSTASYLILLKSAATSASGVIGYVQQ